MFDMIRYDIPYYPISGEGHGGPEVAKIVDFKVSISSAGMYVIKKSKGEL